MLAESLSDQLRRIGTLASLMVIIASGLATFALLNRFVPWAAHGDSLQTVKPAARAASAISLQSTTYTGSKDALTKERQRAARTLAAIQRQELKQAQAQNAAARRALARMHSRAPRVVAVPVVPRAALARPIPAPDGGSPPSSSRQGPTRGHNQASQSR